MLKTLPAYLGRVIRGIGRIIAGDATLKEIFAHPLRLARRAREQRHRQRQPTVSNLDAPRSIASARVGDWRHEFGVKVPVATLAPLSERAVCGACRHVVQQLL